MVLMVLLQVGIHRHKGVGRRRVWWSSDCRLDNSRQPLAMGYGVGDQLCQLGCPVAARAWWEGVRGAAGRGAGV